MNEIKKIYKAMGNSILIFILIAMIATGGLYLLGIHPAIVLSGSMEPEIHTGSLCLINTKADSKQIETGDIIAYKTGDIRVTHRVIEITDEGFQTKGDANDSPDVSIVPRENVIGKTVFWIPYVGTVLAKLNTTTGRILMLAALLIVMLCSLFSRKTKATEEPKDTPDKETGEPEDGETLGPIPELLEELKEKRRRN